MGLVDLKKWVKGILFHSFGQCGKISTIDFFEQNVTSEKFEDYDGEKRKQQSRKPRFSTSHFDHNERLNFLNFCQIPTA